jgi:DNA-binding transcriptional MerR regulator
MSTVRRTPRREYHSITEVCAMLGLKPHVLRYWETQFEDLAPPKNRAGQRVYRNAEIELLALIQRLVHHEKYTIEGARLRLQQLRDQGRADADARGALERSYLRALRAELGAVLELLSPPVR